MKTTIKKVNWNLQTEKIEGITIIPSSYSQDQGQEFYADSAMSFYKYVKDKSDIKIYSTPDLILVQKSAEWFGPVFYAIEFSIANYDSIKILLDLISAYLSEKYGSADVNAKFEIVAKDNKNKTYKSIKYEGSSKNIETVLQHFNSIGK